MVSRTTKAATSVAALQIAMSVPSTRRMPYLLIIREATGMEIAWPMDSAASASPGTVKFPVCF